MARKNNREPRIYEPKDFESDKSFLIGRNYDTSANIFMSMMLSPAWRKLTKNQRLLYIYCKAQYYGKDKKSKNELLTYEEKLEKKKVDTKNRFFFNRELWLNFYKLYSDNGQFYTDMDKLIELGFIRAVEKNQTTRKRNIYEFSSEWQKIKWRTSK